MAPVVTPARGSSLPRPIPDHVVELIGDRLRLLALPLRIQIIDHLDRDGETNVQELTERLAASQQNVSRHLRLLAEAGVLARRRDGRFVWYRLFDQSALRLIENAGTHLVSGTPPAVASELEPAGPRRSPDHTAPSTRRGPEGHDP